MLYIAAERNWQMKIWESKGPCEIIRVEAQQAQLQSMVRRLAQMKTNFIGVVKINPRDAYV
jgi:hypothetical protein